MSGTTLPLSTSSRLRPSNGLAEACGILASQMKNYYRIRNHEGWWVKLDDLYWMLEIEGLD